MRAEVILTTLEDGKLIETVVGHTTCTEYTDYRKLLNSLGEQHFGPRHSVRTDSALFGFTAVDGDGNTIHLK